MYKNIFIFIAITILLISCGGSKRTFETQPPTQRLATYIILEIPNFKLEVPNSPAELQWQLPDQLAKKLKSDNIFTGVSRVPLDISNGVLVVDATVTDIQPPEWYKQIFKTCTIVIKVRFIDKADDIVIAESTFEGTSKWGFISGGMVFADVRAIDELFEYIKANYLTVR